MSKTNYKKMYDNAGKRADINPVDEAIPVEVKEEVVAVKETPVTKTGIVTASLLRVRVAPNPDADVIDNIRKDSEVSIDMKTSTEDWYAVKLENGTKGFCMKRFIDVC